MLREIDLQLTVCFDCFREYVARGVRAEYWQASWEPDGVGAEPGWTTPRHDVLFLANCYSDFRREFVRRLRESKVRPGLYGGGWPRFWAAGDTLYNYRRCGRLIRGAKVVLSDNQWPEQDGFVSDRFFHSLAAGGALLMQQHFTGYERLGFRDGEHFVLWRTVDDLLGKLTFWLEPANDLERRRISSAGQAFCLEQHSFDARVRELLGFLRAGPWDAAGTASELAAMPARNRWRTSCSGSVEPSSPCEKSCMAR
jgi:hypothetical protein